MTRFWLGWMCGGLVTGIGVLLIMTAEAPDADASPDSCFRHAIFYGVVDTGITESTCYHQDGSYTLCRYGGFLGNGWCHDFEARPAPPQGVGEPPLPPVMNPQWGPPQ